MRIAVPREIKNHEYRVAITPVGVHELVLGGHQVFVEAGAGEGSSLTDEEFAHAGAELVDGPDATWSAGELVLKVKEPVEAEYHRMQPGQVLFTYLHLAASRQCTLALLEREVTAIAYETVQTSDGHTPLLAPMSEVAGRLATQAGAYHLMRPAGGRGVLLGGVTAARPATVVVLGAGVAGSNAIAMAVGLQAEVVAIDRDIRRLRDIAAAYPGRVRTVVASTLEVDRAVTEADLVIGAVLVPGARAPKLVTNEMVSRMRPGSVLVDISIDQGGCFEDSRPTTHEEPTFPVHGSVFYCVANMPGAVPHTSTQALTTATLPYAVALADKGWRRALADDPALAGGLSTHAGQLTHPTVAEAHEMPWTPVASLLQS